MSPLDEIELKGKGGKIFKFIGQGVAHVEALNHDDTVRCEMHLYKMDNHYVCQRIERPARLDVRYRVEICKDIFSVYQFFGTEPLANYLYGSVGFAVPGMRRR